MTTNAPSNLFESRLSVSVSSDSTKVATRMCVIGDGLVSGFGDPKALGWAGRVAARTPTDDESISMFTLGVPDEPTTHLLERWRGECNLRWHKKTRNRLVVGLGRADVFVGTNTARSRLNLANILDEAANNSISTFVVGPPPVLQSSYRNAVEDLAGAFADVCDRRDVPFVDCFHPLESHEQWFSDLENGDGYNPGAAGYGLMAWLVLHNGWYSWLGTSSSSS